MPDVDRILITGASGMVGRGVTAALASSGRGVNLAGRAAPAATAYPDARCFGVGEIGPDSDWSAALKDCDTVIHIAAQLPARGVDRLVYNRVNNAGTERLANMATRAGVRRFIFVSSVAAISGAASEAVLTDRTPAKPVNEYGRSKLAAERHVAEFSRRGGLGVSVRPPLVYGPAAQGNWKTLMRLAETGLPLPFASVRNKRSMLAAETLVDAIRHLALARIANSKSGAYLVCDGQDVSLADTLRWLRLGMARSARLFPMPPAIIDTALDLVGRRRVAESLFGDLRLDSSRFCRTFGWLPAVRPETAIRRAGAEYVAAKRGREIA